MFNIIIHVYPCILWKIKRQVKANLTFLTVRKMLKSFITERYLLTLLKLEDEDQLLMASPFLPLVKVLWNSFVYWHFLFESFVSRRKSVLFLVDQLMLLSSHYEIVQSHSSKDFIEISRIWFWYFQKKRSEYLQPKRHHTCNISMFSSHIYTLYIKSHF